ncbi:DUF2218 domain-containing protein [Salinifilum aidingensis]
MPQAHAQIRTERPERYRKQLASHLGRRCTISDEADGGVRITLPADGGAGSCLLTCRAEVLFLDAAGDSAEDLSRVQDVIGRHLERFGEREGLTVTWSC